MGRKSKKNKHPQVNKDLDGFDVKINEFGEITSTYDVNKLNEFLDDNTQDKKFRGVEVVRGKGTGEEEQDDDSEEKVWD